MKLMLSINLTPDGPNQVIYNRETATVFTPTRPRFNSGKFRYCLHNSEQLLRLRPGSFVEKAIGSTKEDIVYVFCVEKKMKDMAYFSFY